MSTVNVNPPISSTVWSGAVYIVDAENGDLVDTTELTEMVIQLSDPVTGYPALQGKLSSGEVTAEDPSLGSYSFRFSGEQTAVLNQEFYLFQGTVVFNNDTANPIEIFRANINAFRGMRVA